MVSMGLRGLRSPRTRATFDDARIVFEMIAQIVGDDTEHLVAPARRRPLLLGAPARRDVAKKDIEPSFARERPAFEPSVDRAVVLLEFHDDPLAGGATNLAEKADLASRVGK